MKRVGQQHMQDNNRCWRRGGHTHTHTGKGHAGMIFMSLYLYGFLISFRGSRPGLGWAGCCTAEGCLAGRSCARTCWRQKSWTTQGTAKKKTEAKSPPKCQQKYDIKLRAHMQSTHAHTHTHTYVRNCSCCCFVLFK